jgi:hypothetical protein
VWKHKPRRHNQVVDALSCKNVKEIVVVLSRFESNFLDRIREMSKQDTTYLKFVEQVKKEGLLYTEGQHLYVPTGGLWQDLLMESHDSK